MPELETVKRIVSESADIASVFPKITAILGRLGPDLAGPGARLRELEARLAAGQFHLAVLGQFKRGKSTLLNCLLGEELLPTSVIPLTAIPTFIYFNEKKRVRIFFEDSPLQEIFAEDASELAKYLYRFVTEEANPHNQLGVKRVEVFHPAAILKNGVVLIDTPGIGSTYKHNTEATLNFLPQCDAALFLLSPDPPLTAAELEFLKQVSANIRQLLFVLNKTDYLNAAEKATVLDFIAQTIQKHLQMASRPGIFAVSARQGLKARLTDDTTLWQESGLAAVAEFLADFLVQDKKRLLQEAVRAKVIQSLGEILLQLQIAIQSLKMPLEDLQRRQQIFEEKVKEASLQRTYTLDILAGDRQRVDQLLEKLAAELRAKAFQALREAVNAAPGPAAENIQQILSEAIPPFFEREFGGISKAIEAYAGELLSAQSARVEQLVQSVRAAAARVFDIELAERPIVQSFEITKAPYWATHYWNSSLGATPKHWTDCLLPRSIRRRKTRKRIDALIRSLVINNVENLRWSVLQNSAEIYRRFASDLDQRFSEVSEVVQGAIQTAITKRNENSERISQEVADLEFAKDQLIQIRNELGHEKPLT